MAFSKPSTADSRFLVYALVDPRDAQVRYVGKSSSGLARPRRHGTAGELAKDLTYKGNWIRELQRCGLTYSVAVLCRLPTITHLDAAEIFWIAEGRRLGWPLTNLAAGGGGTTGLRWSSATKLKMSIAAKGRPKSVRHRESLSRANLGKIPTVEAREKVSAALKGREHSAEHNRRVSEAKRGHVYSPEAYANICEGNRRPFTPERLERMRIASTGKRQSVETRAKRSASLRAAWARRKAAGPPYYDG